MLLSNPYGDCPMFASLFLGFRILLAWALTLIAAGFLWSGLFSGMDQPPGWIFGLLAMTLMVFNLSAIAGHVRRVSLIADRLDTQTLGNRHRRQVELPLDAAGLAALLPTLARDEQVAWRTLAPRWGAALPDGVTDLCAAWQADNLQCFSSTRTSLALIRQLDRPGILTLAGAGGPKVYAVLQGLEGDNAILDIAGVAHAVPLDTLAGLWRGDFATLWRSPPGYPGARAASRSPVVAEWLDTRLASLPGAAPDTGKPGSALPSRLYQFQLAQGLTPDGKVGPMTFMQLNRALGLAEPRLQTAPVAPTPSKPQAGQ